MPAPASDTSRRESGPRVESLRATSYTVPTDAPEADGTLAWNKTTLVLVEIGAAGETGLGFSYGDARAASLIRELLLPEVVGHSVAATPAIWALLRQRLRNVGRPGIGATALSAVDLALWDLRARLVHRPLVELIGTARSTVPVYGSGGFTSYSDDQLCRQLGGWVELGIPRVKMKIGATPDDDPRRVELVRRTIGPRTELYVDANGAFDRKQALAMAEELASSAVRWFEEPVTAEDTEGLRLLRDRAPSRMEIAAGGYGFESGDFLRLVGSGSVDVLQADITRCGGITGFLQVAALCEAFHVPLSAHTAPAMHLHPCAAVLPLRHLEYFHDHVRIERMFFDGVAAPVNGALRPDLTRPGNGLALKRKDVERYAE
jgi:L-alanine-DL-glutamate epimerase-like enolase superfamily enzyme